MKGLIMAGGEGTRLRPLTCTKPKPMVDIMGRPVMEYIIELMKSAGITDIAITLMYMPQVITEHFGDGSKFGVNLTYFVENTPLGTAGSVKNAQDFLDDSFVIVSGDSLTDIDISAAVDFHKQKDAEVTIVLKNVENPLEYGIVITDSNGKIIRFLEKPSWSEVFSDTANTGIYILNPSVLNLIPQNEQYDFSKDLFPKMLSAGHKMFGHTAGGYWCDIGDLPAYKQCHFDILDAKVKVRIDAPESNGIFIHENAQVSQNCVITAPCYIGDGAEISGGVRIMPHSVIGSNCRIFEGASIKKSVVLKNVAVGKSAQLRGAIIDEGVRIGAHCIALEDSVIGGQTRVGDMCEIKNNVKIWPQKTIEGETIVSDNLIWGDNFGRKLFGENGISGEINVDITPEFATRLGAAFGAANKNAKLSVSGGGGGALDMLRSAFISGLLSSGASVYDFGEIVLPIARRAIPFYGLDAGMHILLSKSGGEMGLSLTFLNKDGGNISRVFERKTEMLFMREDFMRCQPDKIKNITRFFDYQLYYIREILNEIKAPLDIKIRVEGSDIAKELLSQMGATVVSGDAKGVISAIIDDYAEKLVLIDEQGRSFTSEAFAALAAQIAAKGGNKVIVSPISGSDTIEKIAMEHDAGVIRCKTGKSNMMECMQKHNLLQFRIMFDAIYAVAKICETLTERKMLLSEMADEIPEIYIVEKEVECIASKKGKVIRSIADIAQQGKYNKIELEEGVKIVNDDGWVLIIPHAQKPACKVISEGINEEYANELCDIYIEHIQKHSK
ncbi:MAG: sugar phosphate nucleotidyltransferase [Firmicutes bacterium]|nr:sugar phosphate nucleotidyltransferase [Bacillota bacterium]